MLSAVIFLTLSVYYRLCSKQLCPNGGGVFSPLRSLMVLLFAFPFVDILLPLMCVYRIYHIVRRGDSIAVFWIAYLALLYVML